MNPNTGEFHRLVSDESELPTIKNAVHEDQAQDWPKFSRGEIVEVKGVRMRITGITSRRLILQPVQQRDNRR